MIISSHENLSALADGIANQFGRDCEVCIHDLKAADLDHTIIYIVNGHITGRQIGDGASKVVLETIEKLQKEGSVRDHLGYRTHTADGRILKSSTIFLRDESGQYRYILGINYDITSFVNMQSSLSSVLQIEDSGSGSNDGQITQNVTELLDSLIEQSVKLIGKTPALMTKEEKIKAIEYLKDAGAFLITKSGDKVSSFYGISKFTLYSYMDQTKKDEN